jgi:UDP-GlcNAc:undecaprenyl-phosphate GlcNAc-1-phosphate transferase
MTLLEAGLLLGASALVSGISTPLVAKLARTVDAVDRPNERKVSGRSGMPLLGGLAVALGCTVGLSLALQLGLEGTGQSGYFEGFLIGASLVLAIGAFDDRYGLGAAPKLLVQIAAASVVFYFGVRVEEFREPLSGIEFQLPLWLSFTVTTLWIVGVTNALNLIDGLDGEATGVGAIIALTLAIVCWQVEQPSGVVLGLVLLGALLGFLPFNFPPARIFLGDTGAYFIGFALAILALEGYQGGHRKAAVLTFAIPLLALAVPILDTLLSIYRRLRNRQPIFSADRRHMHHRLLASRGDQRPAVLALYFLTGCFCIIALSFAHLKGYTAFIFFGAVVILTFRLLRNMGVFGDDTEPPPPGTASATPESLPEKEGEQ